MFFVYDKQRLTLYCYFLLYLYTNIQFYQVFMQTTLYDTIFCINILLVSYNFKYLLIIVTQLSVYVLI